MEIMNEKQLKIVMDYQIERVRKLTKAFAMIGIVLVIAGAIFFGYGKFDDSLKSFAYVPIVAIVSGSFLILSGYFSRLVLSYRLKKHEELMQKLREAGK